MRERSVVGDLINFRGLVYAPINELGVVFLFGKIAHDLNMYVEEIKPGFPDCVARRFVGKGWERVRIEFEHRSSNFVQHGHDPRECDLIACWEHDWKECPVEVLELSSEIRELSNPPIERPGAIDPMTQDVEARVEEILARVSAKPEVAVWYSLVFAGMQELNAEVWAKVGEKYIGWYCPERSFASVMLRATSIHIECFSRGIPIPGTGVSSIRFSPRWAKFSVKSDDDAQAAVGKLSVSYERIREAIAAGEPTGYYSGGEYRASGSAEGSDTEDG